MNADSMQVTISSSFAYVCKCSGFSGGGGGRGGEGMFHWRLISWLFCFDDPARDFDVEKAEKMLRDVSWHFMNNGRLQRVCLIDTMWRCSRSSGAASTGSTRCWTTSRRPRCSADTLPPVSSEWIKPTTRVNISQEINRCILMMMLMRWGCSVDRPLRKNRHERHPPLGQEEGLSLSCVHAGGEQHQVLQWVQSRASTAVVVYAAVDRHLRFGGSGHAAHHLQARWFPSIMTPKWRQNDSKRLKKTGKWRKHHVELTPKWRQYDANMRQYDANMTPIWRQYDANMTPIWRQNHAKMTLKWR